MALLQTSRGHGVSILRNEILAKTTRETAEVPEMVRIFTSEEARRMPV